MTTIVTLANKSYTVGTTAVDSERRRLYFQDPAAYPHLLNKEEKRLLTEMGIDCTMENTLKPYLAEFFDVLPKCQSDTAVVLSKDCEVPYYVLWATKFAEHANTLERIKENKETTRTRMDLRMAMDEAMIRNMKEKVVEQTPIAQVFSLIDMTKVKPLVTDAVKKGKATREAAPGQTVEDVTVPKASVIERIFTLIDLERGDELGNLNSV